MNPDRWRKVEELYHAARAHAAEDRTAFLVAACEGDADLRRDVEELLENTFSRDGFLSTPPPAVAATTINHPTGPILTGRKIGFYQVHTLLGAGGMGEVYQARDLRLGRDVAIKILPGSNAAHPERLARFDREARMLAALNHPHIGAIYGVEEIPESTSAGAATVPALVLELVEGPTLADRLTNGPIPVPEVLHLARQIAEALEAAHEKGIIHRDLKPANIKVTSDGLVKVLDFGLAKMFAEETDRDLSQSPTLPVRGTREGVILGTAAYMSPEQARGLRLDKRTDIWAFGCVLYEMLTGRAPFAGDTVSDLIAAILERQPDWGALPAGTPASLRHVLQRCLEKDPRRRLRDVGDARLELDDATYESSQRPIAIRPRRLMHVAMRRWPLAMAAVLGMVLTAAVATRTGRIVPQGLVSRLDISLPPGTELFAADGSSVAISPDGSQVAAVLARGVAREIYVRQLNQFEMTPIQGTDNARSICFSSDGASVAFLTNAREIKTVSLQDGLVRTIAGDADLSGSSGLTWMPDGNVIFARDDVLWTVPASGGPAKQLTTLDKARGEIAHRWPHSLPAGSVLLFTSYTTGLDSARVEALSFPTGARRAIVERATFPLYIPPGNLLFIRAGALLAAPFNAARLEMTGTPAPVADSLSVGGTGGAVLSVSRTGTLAYAPVAPSERLVWVGRQGDEQPLSTPSGHYKYPRVSPDGRRVAVLVDGLDMWILDQTRGAFTRRTSGLQGMRNLVWAPDGKRLLFSTVGGSFVVDADTVAPPDLISGMLPTDSISAIAPDGETIALLRYDRAAQPDLYALSLLQKREARVILATPAFEGGAQFSPDGRWLAYVSNESGRYDVYLRTVTEPLRKWTVSTQGGSGPVWNRNGRELFYRVGDRTMLVEVSGDRSPVLSEPKLLFERRYSYGTAVTLPDYDVDTDGQRLLMVKEDPGRDRINVISNWLEEVKQRMAGR